MRPNQSLLLLLLILVLMLAPIALLRKMGHYLPKPSSQIAITLLSRNEKRIYHTNLENYLIGVVAAEMPAKFSLEALKAQAVASRTLTFRRLKRFGGRGCQHFNRVDLCDDPSENQAWISVDVMKKKWGQDFVTYYYKIYRSVKDTSGIILTYDGRPIDAVFHSTCGVGTADAVEVWQHSIPYLKSVKCGFDYQSPRYSNQVVFSWNDLRKEFSLSNKSFPEIRIRKRSPQGRVLTVVVGSTFLAGDDFRKLLNLTSTCFTIHPQKNGVVFKSVGYGHGVGMCQYGADGMAKQGYNYRQILLHYYQGVNFSRIKTK